MAKNSRCQVDVGGIHASLEPAVEAQADHAPQPGAVRGEQLVPGLLVPRRRPVEESGYVHRVACHDQASLPALATIPYDNCVTSCLHTDRSVLT